MPEYSTNSVAMLEKVRLRERVAYEMLYAFVFPSIARFVKKNSGTHADAEDIFQDTLMVLVEKAKQPDFRLTSSFKTYLFAISKNLWLKRLRQRNDVLSTDDSVCQNIAEEAAVEYTNEERVKGFMHKVTPLCRLLLRALFYENKPIEQMMQRMGWKNKHSANNQKYKCVQQMKRVAKENPS